MSAQEQKAIKYLECYGPRIYVACLAAYNNGKLHGRWIEADQRVEFIQTKIAAMLASSPIPNAEEHAIHDCEGFEGVEIGEYTSINAVCQIAAFIGEYGKLGGRLLSHFANDLEDAKAAFENYAGEYKCLADFAQGLTEQTTEIPKSLAYYINYESMGRDMALGGDVFTIELGFETLHVFWSW